MTDPASIAAPYVVKEVSNARIPIVNDGSGHMVCQATDKANALMIATALNTADARDADYLDLFAAYHSVKREYSYALSAVDVLKDENMILRELAHCVYMFRDATGRAEAYPGEHLAVKRQLWGAHDRWLDSQQEGQTP